MMNTMKTKIGIMTWFRYYNYGSVLQAVALSNIICQLGYVPEVIDYAPRGKQKLLPQGLGYKKLYDEGQERLKRKLFKINRDFVCNERNQKFENFIRKNLFISESRNTMSDLEQLNNEYDAFICGSDQVWSPLCFDPHYFLNFVAVENKMIAYAPSIGTNSIEDVFIIEEMKFLIGRFKHLSVREIQGKKIIQTLTGQEAKVVLDPTLLLRQEDWKKLIGEDEEKGEGNTNLAGKYAIAYFLGRDRNQWRAVCEITRKKKLKLKIIPVFEEDLKRNGCIDTIVGPREFVHLIDQAEYVLTDSFHGLAFAINFRKDFCVFERFKGGMPDNQNSRIYSLLESLNLSNRLFKTGKKLSAFLEPIDYCFVLGELEKARYYSIKYLAGSLKEATDVKEVSIQKNHVFHNSSLCCGCGACSLVCPAHAISVARNEKSFYTAQVDEVACISCGKCRNVCPFIKTQGLKAVESGELYSYKSFCLETLKKSSSGGFAHELAVDLSKKGYSIVGCTFNQEKQIAEHIIIPPYQVNQLHCLQGSKYMQSRIDDVVSGLIEIDTPILVFGTPCQISGIKEVLKSREDIIYVDLICHGVPSYSLYKKYQEFLNRRFGMNTSQMRINFRYKEFDWRHKRIYTTDLIRETCFHQKKDLYLRMYEDGNCYMDACYECRWRKASEADLRIGDYWGERFKKDKTGVSMVVIMNGGGSDVVRELVSHNSGILENHDIKEYLDVQQTTNNTYPVYTKALLNELQSKEVKLEDLVRCYVAPFEFERKIKTYIRKLQEFLEHE